MNKDIKKGAEFIENARNIMVFSGAGLSTESGIPDFRSPGGVWDRYDPSDFDFQNIISDEKIRQKYWQMSTEFYESMRDAKPNKAHIALKKLEDKGKLLAIVTQNIDNLHQKAGNSIERIIELHGNAFSVSCLECGKRYARDQIQERIRNGVKIPYCDDCSGILKPDTISFGQTMPEDKMTRAFICAGECDLCMVLGSSLVVYPAASVPDYALKSGATIMIINRDKTPLDPKAHIVIHESVSYALARMIG